MAGAPSVETGVKGKLQRESTVDDVMKLKGSLVEYLVQTLSVRLLKATWLIDLAARPWSSRRVPPSGVLIVVKIQRGVVWSSELYTHPPTSQFLEIPAKAKRKVRGGGSQAPNQKSYFYIVIEPGFHEFSA